MTILAWICWLFLLASALWVSLPAFSDILAWIGGRHEHAPSVPGAALEPLLFLMPAHDEELLIQRSVSSLIGLDYPPDLLTVAVIADNCSDRTAELARAAGARVIERSSVSDRGKGHAIEWALGELQNDAWTAVIIVDADTVVTPDFGKQLMRWAPLRGKALQAYDTASNEFENWLTRLAGLLTRSRYEVALPLKRRAQLSCPLTGDGVILGREVLAKYPWRVQTITEGWELYARLTLAGLRVGYASNAVVYAQAALSLDQSKSQRQRWTAGRFQVLRLYLRQILQRREVGLQQRLDLLAELSNPGPVLRGAIAGSGTLLSLLLPFRFAWPVAVLFLTGVAQPMLYALIAIRVHPQPGKTMQALAHLPGYVGWRVWIALGSILQRRNRTWVRTARTDEGSDGHSQNWK